MARIAGIATNPLFGFSARMEDRDWQREQRDEQRRQISERRALDQAMGQAAVIMGEAPQYDETKVPAQWQTVPQAQAPTPAAPPPALGTTESLMRGPDTAVPSLTPAAPSFRQETGVTPLQQIQTAPEQTVRRQKNTPADKMSRITALLAKTPGAGLTAFKAAEASEDQQRKMDRDVIELMGKADPKTVAWYIKQSGQEDRYGDLLKNPSAMTVVTQTARTMAQMGIKGDDALEALGAMMEAMSQGVPHQQAFQQAVVKARQAALSRPEGQLIQADQGLYQRNKGGDIKPVMAGGQHLTRTPADVVRGFIKGGGREIPRGGVAAERDQMKIEMLSKIMPYDQAVLIVHGGQRFNLTPAQRLQAATSMLASGMNPRATLQDMLGQVDAMFPQAQYGGYATGAPQQQTAPRDNPRRLRFD